LQQTHPDYYARFKAAPDQCKLLSYILHNVEITINSASKSIMTSYASLVEDPTLRQRFLKMISDEFDRTEMMLADIFGGHLEQRRPHVAKTIALRDEGLNILHTMQLAQLQHWRKDPSHGASLERLLVTLNAIASGLRNTG
jgi:phosphoenolpyruvate carboxylase